VNLWKYRVELCLEWVVSSTTFVTDHRDHLGCLVSVAHLVSLETLESLVRLDFPAPQGSRDLSDLPATRGTVEKTGSQGNLET
jgi:hypothetical protein